MQALADRLITLLLALAGLAALRQALGRSQDLLEAQREAFDRERERVAQERLELVNAARFPGHVPMLEDPDAGPRKLTISEDDELRAHDAGEAAYVADAIEAELAARASYDLDDPDDRRALAALRDRAVELTG